MTPPAHPASGSNLLDVTPGLLSRQRRVVGGRRQRGRIEQRVATGRMADVPASRTHLGGERSAHVQASVETVPTVLGGRRIRGPDERDAQRAGKEVARPTQRRTSVFHSFYGSEREEPEQRCMVSRRPLQPAESWPGSVTRGIRGTVRLAAGPSPGTLPTGTAPHSEARVQLTLISCSVAPALDQPSSLAPSRAGRCQSKNSSPVSPASRSRRARRRLRRVSKNPAPAAGVSGKRSPKDKTPLPGLTSERQTLRPSPDPRFANRNPRPSRNAGASARCHQRKAPYSIRL